MNYNPMPHCALIRSAFCLFVFMTTLCGRAQQAPPTEVLTVEKIMQDPKWIGTSPSSPYWSADGQLLFFKWNPEQALSDSFYYVTREDLHPRKAPYALRQSNPSSDRVAYNTAHSSYTYDKDGDVFWAGSRNGVEKRITNTVDKESKPAFSFRDTRIVYTKNDDLFAWDLATGLTTQLTDFRFTVAPKKEFPQNAQEKWLQEDQLQLFGVLRDRNRKKILGDSIDKANKPAALKPIYLGDKKLSDLKISPDGRFITYASFTPAEGARSSIVPSYVTESGFTRDIPSRTKVGAPLDSYSFFIFDRAQDTVLSLLTNEIPGITDTPDFMKEYPAKAKHPEDADAPSGADKRTPRRLVFDGPYWSDQGGHAVLGIRSQDHKDRWIMLLDAATGKLKLLDRQHDEAWIAGPGVGDGEDNQVGNSGWIDENDFWYQSEASGYSHLYRVNVVTGEKTQLTHGAYEVIGASLSKGKKYFYITTNEKDPGQQQFYRLPVQGGSAEAITTMAGANLALVSPDEQQIAFLNSYTNRPWELYVQDNRAPGSRASGIDNGPTGKEQGRARQITSKAMSPAFRAYPWRDPEIITFTASDGALVRAKVYRPSTSGIASGQTTSTSPAASALTASTAAATIGSIPTGAPRKPGVIFVHGAGYLQNVHKWWSYYFHEFMFNNLLADNGYTVMDIDYRGSAGYGRNWRTAIYRHMGGKDLSDQVDGARWLVEHEGVDPKRIGIYGGSYGGFITLMALFTSPNTFAAGAALRSVTDWAHYEHPYTSSILNEPSTDSIAYRQSSPIYFAEGLKGHLLMCHGMMDENVHFQDIVRLTQRLIELGKDNWELAVYPLEDHAFVEPSSWTDEYKRIYKLFNSWLKSAPLPQQ